MRSNYGNSEFYNLSRDLYYGNTTIGNIITALEERIQFSFNEDGSFKINAFYDFISNKLERKNYSVIANDLRNEQRKEEQAAQKRGCILSACECEQCRTANVRIVNLANEAQRFASRSSIRES
jgi:hypothetical protein